MGSYRLVYTSVCSVSISMKNLHSFGGIKTGNFFFLLLKKSALSSKWVKFSEVKVLWVCEREKNFKIPQFLR